MMFSRMGASPPSRGFLSRIAAGALLALLSLPTSRSGAQDVPRLSLGDVYQATTTDNKRIAAAWALARAADARVPSAHRPPDPQLQLGFMNYALPELRPMETVGMTVLQLMQMVPVAGKLGLAGRVATAQASAQAERARDVGWELRSDVAMVFYELYRTDRGLTVARESLRLLQDIRKISEMMYRVGEGRQADVLRAQVEIARMVEDTIRMTTMRTGMAARLNALLDRSVTRFVASPALPVFPELTPSLESLVALADAGRPMVRAGEREVEAAEWQARLARREIWPDLTVGLQLLRPFQECGRNRVWHCDAAKMGSLLPYSAGVELRADQIECERSELPRTARLLQRKLDLRRGEANVPDVDVSG